MSELSELKNKVVRLQEVIDRTGRSRSSIYADVKAGHFPPPFKLGVNARAIGWSEAAIDRWIEEQMQRSATNGGVE